MTKWAFDIDGTIDSFPYLYQQWLSALTAKGDAVWIITGADGPTVTPDEVDAKRDYLASLGITQYSDLVVLPEDPTGGHSMGKAKCLMDNGIDILVDNNRDNIRAAAAEGVMALYAFNAKVLH